ncbi:hypothetical protein [Methylobacterium nonmethylotrophicum]|uniref:Uncharacterized protein n=1 Tax=Methylobacterium nonmethylotrophicum TaxID=1141884 RepID=A0A4Z0NQ08_9HYPH|nr:hypothetical protein [Methylobacterium nonmethylotrophicum]TGD98261.1 hypothetical protein EU555_16260 [Methylobacterium nonmethylotrophicum]
MVILPKDSIVVLQSHQRFFDILDVIPGPRSRTRDPEPPMLQVEAGRDPPSSEIPAVLEPKFPAAASRGITTGRIESADPRIDAKSPESTPSHRAGPSCLTPPGPPYRW